MAQAKKNIKKEYWFRRYPRLSILIIFIVLFSITLSCVEVILSNRHEDLNDKSITKNNRTVKLVEYLPNIDTCVIPTNKYYKLSNAKNLIKKKYKFSTDEHGFIKPSKIHSNSDITIAFLGSSVTECLFVQEKNRFPYLASRLLEKKTGMKINSYNAGVASMNSMDAINILLNKLLPLKVDYIILSYNLTDLGTFLLYKDSYWNGVKSNYDKHEDEISLGQPIRRFIWKIAPHTCKSINDNFNRFSKKTADLNQSKTFDSDRFLHLYEQNLNIFISICNACDITPILMTEANRYTSERPKSEWFNPKVNYSDFIRTNYRMNDIIRETAMENNVILIDLEKEIPKDTIHIYDICHLNDNGAITASKVIADVLSNYLVESKRNKSIEIK